MVQWRCKTCANWYDLSVTDVCSSCKSYRHVDVPVMEEESRPTEFGDDCRSNLPNDTPGATAAVPPVPIYRSQSSRIDVIQQQIDENEAKEKLARILTDFEKRSIQFSDTEFPADSSSLYYDSIAPSNSAGRPIEWIRISNITAADNHNGEWVVMRDPKATDIEQGTLGNCWFISALSVVAERPALIDRVLLTREVQKAGAYQVRLFHDGQWVTVTIDDFFPCEKKMLIYSQARRKQLWVPLIEKAAAKLHRCYEALIAGHTIESLRMLTGAPCETLLLNEYSEDELWATLLSCHDSDFLFGASSGDKGNDTEFEEMGLRRKHAYSILDIVDCDHHRLIKLKNPWARFSWRGGWSASSELWDLIPEPKRKKMLQDCEMEGIFWMCLADFKHFFNAVDVCRLRPDWHDLHLGSHLPLLRLFETRGYERVANSVKVNIITVERPTVLEMVLQQSSVRQSADLSLVDLGLIVVRGNIMANSRCSVFTENKRYIRLFTNLHVVLDPGTYSVICFSFAIWHSLKAPIYSVLSIHSRFPVFHTDYPMTERMLRDALITLLDNKGERREIRNGVTSYYLQKGWCGLLLMTENRTESYLEERCDCEDSVNVVSSRGALKTCDVIPPLSRQLVMILTQVEVYERYSIAHRLQVSFSRRSASSHEPELDGHLHEPQSL